MASLNLDIPEDFLKDVLSASFEDIAVNALEEAEPILKESIQNSIRAAETGEKHEIHKTGKHRSSGIPHLHGMHGLRGCRQRAAQLDNH